MVEFYDSLFTYYGGMCYFDGTHDEILVKKTYT